MRLSIKISKSGQLYIDCGDPELELVFNVYTRPSPDPLYTKQRQHLEDIVEMFNMMCGEVNDSTKAED